MLSTIFTVIIVTASIYFFYQANFLISVPLLIWAVSRFFGLSSLNLIKRVTTQSTLERNCNVNLQFHINISQILSHPSLDYLFEKLKHKGITNAVTKADWNKCLLDNYKDKFKNDDIWEAINFKIKNNLVWVNEKIDFRDNIYYEFFIPYVYNEKVDDDEVRENSFLTPEIELGIKIRIFIVNGIIKLQVGYFSEEYSPKILKDSGLGVYQTYETITSFPLMYFWSHGIPEKYLNLSAYATEAWKLSYADKKNTKKDLTADWKELNREIRDYNYLCSQESVASNRKTLRIAKRFEKKRKEWLSRESSENRNLKDNDDWHDWPGKHDISYGNKNLIIQVSNFNSERYRIEKHVLTDYREERP